MMKTAASLREEIESLVEDLAELLSSLPVVRSGLHDIEGVVVVAPDNTWGELSISQKTSLLMIKRRYEEWLPWFRSASGPLTEDLERDIELADKGIRSWIEQNVSWGLSLDPAENVKNMRASADGFLEVLAVLEQLEAG